MKRPRPIKRRPAGKLTAVDLAAIQRIVEAAIARVPKCVIRAVR